ARANHFTRSEPALAVEGTTPAVVAVSSMSVLLQLGRPLGWWRYGGSGRAAAWSCQGQEGGVRAWGPRCEWPATRSNQAISCTRLHLGIPTGSSPAVSDCYFRQVHMLLCRPAAYRL